MKNSFFVLLLLLIFATGLDAQTLKGEPIATTPPPPSVTAIPNHEVAISADGDRVAVSSYFFEWRENYPAGHVEVFQWSGNAWNRLGEVIEGENLGDHFGKHIALSADGNRLIVGAMRHDGGGRDSGKTYLYEYDSGSRQWKEIHSVVGDASQWQGVVDISDDGKRFAVGSLFSTGSRGHILIYEEQSPNSWVKIGDLTGDQIGDRFGMYLELSGDGNTLIGGAPGSHSSSGHTNLDGKAKVFKYDGTDWNQVGETLTGSHQEDFFGKSVAISANGGKIAAAASWFSPSQNLNKAGHITWTKLENDSWTSIGLDINGNESNEQLGSSIVLSGDGSRLAATSYEAGGKIKIYDLDVTGTQWTHTLDFTRISSTSVRTFDTHLALSEDGSTVAVPVANGKMVNVYTLPSPDHFSNTFEDGKTYFLEGAGQFSGLYWKVTGIEKEDPIRLHNLPATSDQSVIDNFRFKAHVTGNEVRLESISSPGYFVYLGPTTQVFHKDHLALGLGQPTGTTDKKGTFVIVGSPTGEPGTTGLKSPVINNYYVAFDRNFLVPFNISGYFQSYQEAKDKATFRLIKN